MHSNEPTICRYGHAYTATSFEWRTNRRNGARYRYCLVCPADWRDRAAQAVVRPDAVKTPRYPTCKRGHEFSPDNTLLRERSTGVSYRECRACRPHRLKAWREGYRGADLTARVDELVVASDCRRALIAARAAK